MITKLTKWLLCVASCKWLFILQILGFSYSVNKREFGTYKIGEMHTIVEKYWYVFLILIILIVLSIIIEYVFFRVQMNTRIHIIPEDDAIFDTAISLSSLAVSVFLTVITPEGIVFGIALFILIGLIFVSTNSVFALPIFCLNGYYVYKTGKIRIITKMSKDAYRIKLDDSPDGIQARELVPGTFIIIDNIL